MNRIRLFFAQWIRAITIFPLSFVILTVMSVVWIAMVYSDYDNTQYLLKIMISCLVALPLTILSPLQTYISNKETTYKDVIISALWVGIGILYYIALPLDFEDTSRAIQISTTWWIVLSRLSLLFIIAWKKKDIEIMTWVWWKEFLLSIVMWWLAGGIIWWGISASLASLDYLFWLTINSKAYGYVWIVSMIFITWAIALIHIVNQDPKHSTPEYGRTMRIFGHYIFLPLTIIYGCILISYGIKILISWVWPKWMIVYMVTWYVGFWILTRLATYPSLPNNFISKAHRGLFISFLLTSFLMIQAARMRIDQYGFTVARYFVCAIIVWIIIASIGSIFFAKRRYMIMITTLLVLWWISIYGGKINAVSVANNSQKNLLIQSLAQYNITLPLASWSLATITSWDAGKVYNTIYYICNAWDIDTIDSLLPESEKSKLANLSSYVKADYVFNYAWLDYENRYDPIATPKELYFSWDESINQSKTNEPISTLWYSSLYMLNHQKSSEINIVTIYREKEKFSVNLWEYTNDIYNIITAVNSKGTIPETTKDNIQYTSWGIAITTDSLKLILTNVSGFKTLQDSWDIYTIQYYMWYVLLR